MTQAPESIPSKPIGLTLTSFDPAFSADPHKMLDELREMTPVIYDSAMQRYILTRLEDVEAVLRNRELMVDGRKAPEGSFMRMQASRRGPDDAEPSMLQLDPPEHDRLRGLVNKAFTPKAVDRMAPRIQEITDELLDAVQDREEWELIGDFSAPLPTIVIAEMLGVDPHMQAQFKKWSDAVVQSFNPFLGEAERAAIEGAATEMGTYLNEAIDARRRDRREDLITGMVEAEENGDQMNNREIVTMVSLLLLAGNLTTTDLIGNGMRTMLLNRDQWDLLKSNPDLVGNTVEEMLRFDPPVTQSGRLAVKETEVAGCPIHAGSVFSPQLLGANHDPAANPDPHKFDITREEVRHVSFGGGRRYCLGAPLARLEARIAVGSLARRLPELRLATDTFQWRNVPVFRGLVTLPVRHG